MTPDLPAYTDQQKAELLVPEIQKMISDLNALCRGDFGKFMLILAPHASGSNINGMTSAMTRRVRRAITETGVPNPERYAVVYLPPAT